MQGNQAMAGLLSRACNHFTEANNINIQDPAAWAAWTVEGWQTRNFPLTGFAYGQDMGQWATYNAETFKTYKRNALMGQALDPTHLIHASLRNLNAGLSVDLLEKGADPLVVDASGWNGFQYLADWARGRMDGHQENALARIITALDKLHGKQSTLWQEALIGEGMDAWQIMCKEGRIGVLVEGDYKGPRQDFFTRLHQARCEDPSLWKWEDAKIVIEGVCQDEKGAGFEKFAGTLPAPILDDLLLALFNPDRWPRSGDEPEMLVRNGQRMAQTLLAKGANFNGQDIQGNKIGDLWEKALKAEESLEQSMQVYANLNSVVRMPEALEAKAIFEAQRINQATPAVTTHRSIRL